MTRNELRNMADIVAAAVLNCASDDPEAWTNATEDERNDAREVAYAAMGAHDAVLTLAGYRSVPPGTLLAPTCEAEAKAMVAAGRDWLQKQPTAILKATPGDLARLN